MAGVVPFSGGTPGRKQWNIKDRKSSKRLRSQLAEDGCPESQVVLAKQLLQEKSVISVNDNEENARLGVFWLIKASEQGNTEATDILRQCLETGEGITEHNYVDVKTCLNTSQNEKLAKRAAREMFLSLSAGQDFITSEQLRRRMNKIDIYDNPSISKSKEGNQNLENDFLEHEKDENTFKDYESDTEAEVNENISGRVKTENFGEKLTEDHLESAASHYSRGELPLVQGFFSLTDSQSRNGENLGFLQRAFLHSFRAVNNAHLNLLKHFSLRYRNRFFFLYPSSTFLQLSVVFFIYPHINFENLVLFLPMCAYYVSFFLMIVSTLQMLQSQREYRDFRVWSRLFLNYDRDGNLNTDDAEFEFCKKNLRPYGVFFFNLLLNLISYPFISELWIPQSEFAIISFVLTFLTLYSFREKTSRKVDFLLLFSFAINVLAKYPYENDGVVRQTWRFLDIELPTLQNYGLPCFASQIVGNGVEFCLNFHGFFYLLIPGIFFKLASRQNWRGTYKILIPHCVTLSWWQVAVFSCQGATFYGLLRSTLALVGLVFFLPFAGIATTVLPILALLKQVVDFAYSSKTLITIVLIVIPLVVGYQKAQLSIRSSVIKIQILLAIISALLLLSHSLTDVDSVSDSESETQDQLTLSWDQYSSLCQKSLWDKRSDAELQFECVHLSDVKVRWDGIVENVRIVKIHNSLLKVLDSIPESIRSKILCYYGERYNTECGEENNKMSVCKVLKQVMPEDKCHINSWNKYDIEISVKMNADKWNSAESTIRILVDDSMKNFTLKLQPKDHIMFSGIMSHPETIGSDSLLISAVEMSCIRCSDKSLTSIKRQFNKYTGQYFAKEVYNGFKRILNFIFNPIINFR